MRSSCRSMTITFGCSRPAIAIASAPSVQVITRLPAARSRYAIRSLLALLSSTTRTRSSSGLNVVPRHDEAEDAAVSELAAELDGPAQKACQALADVEPEACAFAGRGYTEPLELLERLEQLGLVFLLDPHAGVDHVEADGRVPLGRPFVDLDAHLAGVCELDRVAAEIDQDLVQRPAVGAGLHGLLRGGHGELETFVASQGAETAHHLSGHLGAIQRQKVSFPLARLDLGEVQQIVDYRQQMAAARLHRLELLLLLGVQRAGQLHEQGARKTDDGIQGSSQLVAHAREEAVLRLVSALQLEVRLLQLLLEAFALGDLAHRREDSLQLVVRVEQRRRVVHDDGFLAIPASGGQLVVGDLAFAQRLTHSLFGTLRLCEVALEVGTDQLVATHTHHCFHLLVDVGDRAHRVGGDQGVDVRLDQRPCVALPVQQLLLQQLLGAGLARAGEDAQRLTGCVRGRALRLTYWTYWRPPGRDR